MTKKGKRAKGRKRGGAKPVRGVPADKKGRKGKGKAERAKGHWTERDPITGAFAHASRKAGGSAPVHASWSVANRKRKPRMKMSDALRGAGLDEARLACKWRRILGRIDQTGGTATPASEKLLLDVLKECSKLLDAYPASRIAAPGEGGAPMQFVSNVARPVRGEAGVVQVEADSAVDGVAGIDEGSAAGQNRVAASPINSIGASKADTTQVGVGGQEGGES
jgi:hypothetical protein